MVKFEFYSHNLLGLANFRSVNGEREIVNPEEITVKYFLEVYFFKQCRFFSLLELIDG
jgi:hypothetical protein